MVTFLEFTGLGIALMSSRKVLLRFLRGKHGHDLSVDAEGLENVLGKIIAQSLSCDALKNESCPVKIDLYHISILNLAGTEHKRQLTPYSHVEPG
jgi:hypothetical protein